MGINKTIINSQWIVIASLLCFSLLISACSSNKSMTNAVSYDEIALSRLKNAVKFETQIDAVGDLLVTFNNESEEGVDLSPVAIHIQHLPSEKYITFTLEDLKVNSLLMADKSAKFEVLLNETIAKDFGGQQDKYGISITYDSDTPLDQTKDKNIYYVIYKYKGN